MTDGPQNGTPRPKVPPSSVERWLTDSSAAVRERGLPEIVPVLEGLVPALRALRAADFNSAADQS